MVLCRGVFHVTVHEAKDLPKKKTLLSEAGSFISGVFGKGNKADYVSTRIKIKVGNLTIGKTRAVDDDETLSPVWEEHFRDDVAVEADFIQIGLHAAEMVKKGCYGKVCISLQDIMARPNMPTTWKIISLKEQPMAKNAPWFPFANDKGKKLKHAEIRLTICFDNHLGISEVPDAYFPQTYGNSVTLYQDAETPCEEVHRAIRNADGTPYQPACAWKDIYNALVNAKYLIYFSGWSVWTGTELVRDLNGAGPLLGSLLRDKAEEGVKVAGLVWDEKTSGDVLPGLMGTHDEDTARYFKDTKVDFALVYRQKKDNLASQWSSTCYSHHQKCVILDVQHPYDPSRRCLQAFVGGLDLTSGRYDTPQHQLFSTLTTIHKDDFYQNCAQVSAQYGPRQPWHDIHCKLLGPVAWDVLKNFEERWQRQAPDYMQDRLLNLSENRMIDQSFKVQDQSTWACQFFRSITADSAKFDSQRHGTLTTKAKVLVEDTIHRAYIQQIRQANKFIYIENQYFLGSAYGWVKGEKPKANHLIPFEIACKLEEKIANGQPFRAYIVMPMYPEGDPTTAAVQEILYWQRRTMQMMYNRVATAIAKHRVQATPQDYLQFFCLGNREAAEPIHLPQPEPNTIAAQLRRTRRFMIYVHSKMIIVDDSYILIGSANINQRSMSGTRDTELAVGCHQPNYMCDGHRIPRGAIHAFRKSLWAEHTGRMEPWFDDPSTEECMSKMIGVGKDNWRRYEQADPCPMYGHLMCYPVQVAADGTISNLPGVACFPDTKATILGSNSAFLPNKLTT